MTTDPITPGAPDAGSTATVADSTWVTASAELRSTAKWMIAALAAVGAVVFGAGPIIARPTLSFNDDIGQLLLAAFLGSLGLIGIGILIFAVSKVLLPVEMSLDDLPEDLKNQISTRPESLLPADASTLAGFRQQLAALRTSAVEIPDKADDFERIAAAEQKKGNADAFWRANEAASAYRSAEEDTKANLAIYEDVRNDLINRGAYSQLSTVFSTQTKRLWVGAVMAGLGGLGFQLALTSVPAGEDAGAETTSYVNSIGILSPTGDGPSEFWNQYGLEACETSEGQVPVLITGGAGTPESPYFVQTIPESIPEDPSGCPPITFVAHPDLFSLVTPTPEEITFKNESDK